jgi:hypothetical protein
VNPKDLIGSKKISTFVVPDTAIFHLATAHMDGARKYGRYNWREKAVQASIYLDAIKRHLAAYSAGEEKAEDSGVLHLAHVMGCCSILIDAAIHDKLIDDRHKSPQMLELLKELNAFAAERRKPTKVHDLVRVGEPGLG